MSSEREELVKTATPCKMCAFSEYTDGVQSGCAAGRIDRFRELGEVAEVKESDDKTYSVVSRFCNYFRTEKWTEDKEKDEYLDIVKRESALTFGLVINCEDHTEEKIEKTINCIQNVNYDKNKITILLHVDKADNITTLVHQVNVLKKDFKRVYLVKNQQDIRQIKDYDIFTKCANRSHFTTMKIGGTFAPNLFYDINETVNTDLSKVVFMETEHTETIVSALVKRQYLNYLNYELMSSELKEHSKKSDMYIYYEEKT